jgi:proteasome alpha subunit
VAALDAHGSEQPRTLTPSDLEVAMLDRSRTRRTFRRLDSSEVAALLSGTD